MNTRTKVAALAVATLVAGAVVLLPARSTSQPVLEASPTVPPTTEAPTSTTTSTTAPTPVETTTTTPPPPQPAPDCSAWRSQAEAQQWMNDWGWAFDTSNIDTDGDGKPCTQHFAPPPPPPTTTPKVTSAPAAAPSGGSGRCGGDLPPCYVMMRESGGNIRAKNPSSTASGKWQFLDSTWQGYGGYARAMDAPEEVQDARARALWAGGRGCGHWLAC